MTIRLVAVTVVVAVAGCDDLQVDLPTPLPAGDPVAIGSRYDPAAAGSIFGSVAWVGDRADAPPIRIYRHATGKPVWHDVPNPNAPRITPEGRLIGVVVYLRGVDPETAAPWPHPPVAVEADDDRITATPGGRVGFVRAGDEVEFRSASDSLLGVRAREAAFFTHMLPDHTTARHRLDRPGRVELTSPANVYWAVADLFVCEHPYFTRTDDHGRFHFGHVPPGIYEAVCWVPGWEIASTERDPETGAVFRAKYAPPAEVGACVRVTTGAASDVRINMSVDSFPSR